MTLPSEQIDNVTAIVDEKMAKIQEWAVKAATNAQSAVSAIGQAYAPTIQVPALPAATLVAPVSHTPWIPPNAAVTELQALVDYVDQFVPTSTVTAPGVPTMPDIQYATALTTPSVTATQIPAPPVAYTEVAIETPPEPEDITLPTFPGITEPTLPTMPGVRVPLTLSLPNELPPFTELPPDHLPHVRKVENAVDLMRQGYIYLSNETQGFFDDFQNVAMGTLVDDGGLTDEFLLELREMQYAEFHYRNLVKYRREVRKLEEQYASRNFGIPPGTMMADRIEQEGDMMRDLKDKDAELTKEVWDKKRKLRTTQVDFVNTVGDKLNDALYENVRTQLSAALDQYQLQYYLLTQLVTIYNTKAGAYGTFIERQRDLASFFAKLQGWEGEVARVLNAITEVNRQNLQVFKSRLKVTEAQQRLATDVAEGQTIGLDSYSAYVRAFREVTNNIKSNIGNFAAALDGYSSALGKTTEATRAYLQQVQTESSRLAVSRANVKGYGVAVDAETDRQGVALEHLRRQIQVRAANLSAFQKGVATNQAAAGADAQAYDFAVQLTGDAVAAYGEYLRGVDAENAAHVQAARAETTYSLVDSETAARAEALYNTGITSVDKLNIGGLAGQATALSALAQGAMSVLNVNATATGSGSVTGSYGFGTDYTSIWGGSTTQSESRSRSLSG